MQEDPSQTGYSKMQFVGLYVCPFKVCLPAASMEYFNVSTGNLQSHFLHSVCVIGLTALASDDVWQMLFARAK